MTALTLTASQYGRMVGAHRRAEQARRANNAANWFNAMMNEIETCRELIAPQLQDGTMAYAAYRRTMYEWSRLADASPSKPQEGMIMALSTIQAMKAELDFYGRVLNSPVRIIPDLHRDKKNDVRQAATAQSVSLTHAGSTHN